MHHRPMDLSLCVKLVHGLWKCTSGPLNLHSGSLEAQTSLVSVFLPTWASQHGPTGLPCHVRVTWASFGRDIYASSPPELFPSHLALPCLPHVRRAREARSQRSRAEREGSSSAAIDGFGSGEGGEVGSCIRLRQFFAMFGSLGFLSSKCSGLMEP
jgi:hypothetical protein